MPKSDRDQQLTPVLRGELDRDTLAEGRRRTADVDGDVEDAAVNEPHQFGLREGRRLEVQPPQSAPSGSNVALGILHVGLRTAGSGP